MLTCRSTKVILTNQNKPKQNNQSIRIKKRHRARENNKYNKGGAGGVTVLQITGHRKTMHDNVRF